MMIEELRCLEKSLGARLRAAGEDQGWWGSSKMIVAVSGGGDSVAMGALLKRFWRGTQIWGHVDHGIRDVSYKDAQFVESLAMAWGIRCVVARRSVPSQRLKGESIEMAARRIRHEFLGGLASSEGCQYVATAHSLDDQVETVMLNLTRGAGIWGLAGIPHRRGPWVRPVISIKRVELRRYLQMLGIEWVEDETNQSRDYVRNRIRLDLIPWIEGNLNPAFSDRIFDLSVECITSRRMIKDRREAILPWLRRPSYPAEVAWDRGRAASLSSEDLAEALRGEGACLNLPSLDRLRVQELVRKIKDKGPFSCPWKGGWWLLGDRERVYFLKEPLAFCEVGRVNLAELLNNRGLTLETQWGPWVVKFDVPSLPQAVLSRSYKNLRLGYIPLDPASPEVMIQPFDGTAPAVPSPLRHLYPMVTSSLGEWHPGGGDVISVSRCAIIARVRLTPKNQE
ncbi:MAG: tRNA lysidine(34) synthetase TilS [Thermanaerothrix sp.]|nr:tRNA lysidine(34) synthetase TilS [Thermanaerothrix sp.]